MTLSPRVHLTSLETKWFSDAPRHVIRSSIDLATLVSVSPCCLPLDRAFFSNSYHMKYMFTGDGVKADAEKVIRGLKPPLRTKMRFISKGVESLAVSSRPAPYSINAL